MEVQWAKWKEDQWFTLSRLNLETVPVGGVYIIFTPAGKVIYVGQGDVADRLEKHLQSTEIMQYDSQSASLHVTFASVPAECRDGVERFLADTFNPLEGTNHPVTAPIPVNLPA